jgi:PAS domain S-box-containing protein
MRLRTRLNLNLYISLGVIVLMTAFLVWSFWEASRAEQNLDLTVEMQKAAFERTVLRDEYFLSQEERTKNQWKSRTEHLGNLLEQARTRFTDARDVEILMIAQEYFDNTKALFASITDILKQKKRGREGKNVFGGAEKTLVGQIFSKAYLLNDALSRLHALAHQKAAKEQNEAALFLIAFIIMVLIVIIANSAITNRILSTRVSTLRESALAIGKGNLDHRVEVVGNDELSDLGRITNEMAAKLKQSHTSVDNLHKEIEERKRTEEALQESERKLSEAQKMAQLGYWSWDVKTGSVEWSEEVYNIFHLNPDKFTPHIDSILALSPWPEDNERDKELIRMAIELHQKGDYEQRFLRPDGSTGYYYSTFQGKYDEAGNLITIIGTVLDITKRKNAEKQLKNTVAELERSNKELEQFAYIASHDLQEPLRMVSSYTLLLEDRYGDRLDQNAKEYIQYAVNGAKRMQRLIRDLLSYSRISTRGQPLERMEVQDAFSEAVANLQASITETGAQITSGALPAIMGDYTQIVQLFQNLIGNSIKFRQQDEPPRVSISAEPHRDDTRFWLIKVGDNGIGIDPKYFDRLFTVFRRLHTQQQYDGTGIGLALCKRIVLRHGGKIWLESEPGKGTTCCFTLPAAVGKKESKNEQ